MTTRYYANAPATTLTSSVSDTATSLPVAAVTGFPIQFPYTLILDRGTATEEAVSVTAASGTNLTVTRHIDGTTAFSHAIGATVEHGITAQDIREPNTHINTGSGVHGLAGSVVGDTDTQTLTNKTIAAGSNTINGLGASVLPQTDGTGKLVAGTKAIPAGAVVGTTDTQTLTNKTVNLASNTLTGTLAQFNTALSDGDFAASLVGELKMWPVATAPTNFMICDGTAVSRTTYSALYALIGTTFGAGDGTTTFNLPNFQGRVPVGVGTATGANGATAHTLAQTGGEETHLLTAAESGLPDHTHTQNLGSAWSTVANAAGSGVIGNQNTSTTAGVTGGAKNATNAHNNMQPYLGINFIIRYA